MTSCVYDKTDKGREEIATRKYRVPSRLRTLLLLIDGRKPLDALLGKLAGLGLNEDNVNELLKEQFITLLSPAAEAEPPRPHGPVSSGRARIAARARLAAVRASAKPAEDDPGPPPGQDSGWQPDPAPLQVDEAERFRALYEFYNQTIKSTVGLRGFGLQLKVEKAANVDQFRALRQQYLEAVFKSKGRDMALGLRDRLDGLLGGKPERDDFMLPDS